MIAEECRKFEKEITFRDERFKLEVCTGRIFQARAPIRMAAISAYPEKEIEIFIQTRPGPEEKLKYWPEPCPARIGIQNFDTGPCRPLIQIAPDGQC